MSDIEKFYEYLNDNDYKELFSNENGSCHAKCIDTSNNIIIVELIYYKETNSILMGVSCNQKTIEFKKDIKSILNEEEISSDIKESIFELLV